MSTIPFPKPVQERPPVISRRAMLTVSAAAGLSGLCAGYVTLTRPLLRPAAAIDRKPLDLTDLPPSPENTLARRYLAADAPWAAEAKYVVHNGRSVLFFNEWERIKEKTGDGAEEKAKRIRLTPFAMVLAPKEDKPDEQPVTLVGESASIQFAGDVDDITTAEPGRIVGGNVPGMVTLRGPDGLELLGSNFFFSEETDPNPSGIPSPKLWSDDNVAFRQGRHTGRGKGVTIDLFRIGQPETFDSVAVSGVKTLTIPRDVEMDLRLDEGGGGPFASLSGRPSEKVGAHENAEKKEPLPTRVTCSGAFTFNMFQNEAMFEGDVVAARDVAEGGPPDQLECDRLAILFEPATPEGKAGHAERMKKITAGTLTQDDGFQATSGQLSVTQLIATSAAGKTATLRSPSNEFVATLSELRYDAKTGVTSLIRTGGTVDLRQATSRLVCPGVILQPVDGGGPPRVSCIGAGWLVHREPNGEAALSARWSESLHRLRGPDGLDLIRLTGKAQVQQPKEDFTLVADRIDLWLDPKEEAKDGQPVRGKPAPAGRTLVAGGRMKPTHLLAEKVPRKDEAGHDVPGSRVLLRSAELNADADKLDVTFVDPPAAPAATASRRSRAGLMPASQRIQLASAEQPAGPPAAPPPEPVSTSAAAQPAATVTQPAAPRKPPEPIQVVTQTIAVVVERARPGAAPAGAAAATDANRGGQVKEVHTTGGVLVSQKRDEGEEPLVILGDRLDLLNRGKDQELVRIYGKTAAGTNGQAVEEPARVHDQGADLWGMNVNLDRRANVAWVDGKGVLQLPVKDSGGGGLLGSGGGREKKDETAEAATGGGDPKEAGGRRLTVWWQEGMKFDGQTAKFAGAVKTKLSGDTMSCEEMEVRFTERFDFASAGRPKPAGGASPTESRPEVAEVFCHHRVVVAGDEVEAGRHIGKRQAEFGEFHLDRRTGATHAFGPGKILIWRRSEGGNRAGLAANNRVQANSSSSRREAGDWEYIKITFSGESNGNVNHRTTTFEDSVQVVYGPVLDAGQTIDPNRPDHAPLESGWMTCERLTLTQHEKTPAVPAYSEVLAERNVRLDGRDFSGTAEQVTYDESKGQYVLRSFGKLEATLLKRGTDRQGAGDFSGQTITFYPATGKAIAAKATGGGGTLGP
jgi:hypothetical protein